MAISCLQVWRLRPWPILAGLTMPTALIGAYQGWLGSAKRRPREIMP